MRRLAILTTLTTLAIAAAAITTDNAQAHFRLEAPAVMTEQNDLGDPQKTYPCGTVDGALTGDVTAYTAGDTVSITINEQVYHPGHYRVALAPNDMSELPADPPITPSPQDQCASTEIMNPPVYPVIADGMLAHSGPFDGEQTFEVTLPDDVTCDNCTLQVVQYMSSHGAPCFYYHCANISIAAAEGGESTGDPSGSTTGDPTGDPGSTTDEPDPTGASGGSTTTGENPEPGGTEDPSGTSGTPPLTGTDGMGQDDSGDSSGCAVGGSGTAAWLVLIPLFAFSRRRDRRARAS